MISDAGKASLDVAIAGAGVVVGGVLLAALPVDLPIFAAGTLGYALDDEAVAGILESSSTVIWGGSAITAFGTVSAGFAKGDLDHDDCIPSFLESVASLAGEEVDLSSVAAGEMEGADPSTAELEESLWDLAGTLDSEVPSVKANGEKVDDK